LVSISVEAWNREPQFPQNGRASKTYKIHGRTQPIESLEVCIPAGSKQPHLLVHLQQVFNLFNKCTSFRDVIVQQDPFQVKNFGVDTKVPHIKRLSIGRPSLLTFIINLQICC
jgi:hypothetical protein